MLPNFFIVGAPKAGTTSLYHYLKEHPEIYMSPVKEPNYFCYDEMIRRQLFYKELGVGSRDAYERLFDGATIENAVGEASVSYLFYPETPQKIKTAVPNAKIVVVLRDPVERGLSHYLMDYRLGYVNIAFEDIVFRKSTHPLMHLYYQQYVELGLYYRQVKRYLDMFGKGRVKIYFLEDLQAEMRAVLRSLHEFLQVDTSFLPDEHERHNVFAYPRNRVLHALYACKALRRIGKALLPDIYTAKVKGVFLAQGDKPVLSEGVRYHLAELYREDLEHLQLLIGRSVSSWLRV